MASLGYHFIVISINLLQLMRQTDERPKPLSIAFQSSSCKSSVGQYRSVCKAENANLQLLYRVKLLKVLCRSVTIAGGGE